MATEAPERRGLDLTLVGRDRDIGGARVLEPVLVLWGAAGLRQQAPGLWRYLPGARRVRVTCPVTPGEPQVYALDLLPDGAYLAWTAYADRRTQHETLLIVDSGHVRVAALEEVIRLWRE